MSSSQPSPPEVSQVRVYTDGVGNLRKNAERRERAAGALWPRPLRSSPAPPEGPPGPVAVFVLGPYSGSSARGTRAPGEDLTPSDAPDPAWRPKDWVTMRQKAGAQLRAHILTYTEFWQVETVRDWSRLSRPEGIDGQVGNPLAMDVAAGGSPSQEGQMEVDDQQTESLGHAVLIEGQAVRLPPVADDAYDVSSSHPAWALQTRAVPPEKRVLVIAVTFPHDRRRRLTVRVPVTYIGNNEQATARHARLAFARRLQGHTESEVQSELDRPHWEAREQAGRLSQAEAADDGPSAARAASAEPTLRRRTRLSR